MSASDIVKLHRGWIEAENGRDLSRLDDFLHRDFELRVGGAEPVVGIDAYRVHRQGTFDVMPDEELTIDDLFATDDRSVCRWHMSGTLTGATTEGLPASELRSAGTSVFELEEGKLRRGWIFWDSVHPGWAKPPSLN